MRRDDDTSLPSVERLGDELDQAFTRAERIESAAREQAPGARRRSRRGGFRTHRRLLVPALAGAAAICAITALVAVRDGGHEPPLTTHSALAEVATAVLELPIPRPDQFVHTRSESLSPRSFQGGELPDGTRFRDFRFLKPSAGDSWTSAWFCGLNRSVSEPPIYPTERDRLRARRFFEHDRSWRERVNRRRQKQGKPPLPDSSLFFSDKVGEEVMRTAPMRSRLGIGAERLTRRELRRFPSDPRRIYRRILSHHNRSNRSRGGRYLRMMKSHGERLVWSTIVSTLSDPQIALTPRQRAGMVNALGFVPGVKLLGDMTDPKGRHGLGFATTFSGVRQAVVFDRESGTPIMWQDTVVGRDSRRVWGGGWPIGSIVHRYVVLERGIVDRLPEGVKPNVHVSGIRCRRHAGG